VKGYLFFLLLILNKETKMTIIKNAPTTPTVIASATDVVKLDFSHRVLIAVKFFEFDGDEIGQCDFKHVVMIETKMMDVAGVPVNVSDLTNKMADYLAAEIKANPPTIPYATSCSYFGKTQVVEDAEVPVEKDLLERYAYPTSCSPVTKKELAFEITDLDVAAEVIVVKAVSNQPQRNSKHKMSEAISINKNM
jgi:hypothetical protein